MQFANSPVRAQKNSLVLLRKTPLSSFEKLLNLAQKNSLAQKKTLLSGLETVNYPFHGFLSCKSYHIFICSSYEIILLIHGRRKKFPCKIFHSTFSIGSPSCLIQEALKQRDQTVRKFQQEIDSLQFRNDQVNFLILLSTQNHL